jgi:hypothetical protein
MEYPYDIISFSTTCSLDNMGVQIRMVHNYKSRLRAALVKI